MGAGDSPAPPERQPGDPAVWPPGGLDEAESVSTDCAACGLPWRIHRSLSGYRLRCRCGAWIDVPGADVALLPVPEERDHGAIAVAGSETGPLVLRTGESTRPPVEFRGVRGWDGRPLERDPDGSWTLRHASLEVRQRWTTRVVLELVFVMLAFWVPALVLQLSTAGAERALWMPIASVAGALLCLAVVQSSPGLVLECLRGAPVASFVEALAVTALFVLAARGWLAVLEHAMPGITDDMIRPLVDEIGIVLSLFVIAVCPGVFEEIAFRGMIQGRLTRIGGARPAVWISGTAFALAHGVTVAFPIHVGLGLYLGWLRLRSGSLFPCMLLHTCYNGTLVLVA